MPWNIEMFDLFAMHAEWCKFNGVERQAHESVALASISVAPYRGAFALVGYGIRPVALLRSKLLR